MDAWGIGVVEGPKEAEGGVPLVEEADAEGFEVRRVYVVVIEEEGREVGAVGAPEVGEVEEGGGDYGVAEVYYAGDAAQDGVEEDVVA